METVSTNKAFGGVQGVYRHASSSCNCDMVFAVFVPEQAQTQPCPVLWYLSGLTCTHQNVMDKGEYRRAAAEHGLIIVCPDTSPRGEDVPDSADDWQLGHGAGGYVNATQAPWDKNYQMYDYVLHELPALIGEHFNADMTRQSIFGHSMGGQGALTMALKNPEKFKSCSAFAPICSPSTADWSRKGLSAYLGAHEDAWRAYDSCLLIEDGKRFSPILVDQGADDQFLDGCNPTALQNAVQGTDIDLDLRMQPGYDHSYFFISSFMAEHVGWHAMHLAD